jgi:hypothetical protein
VETRQMLIPQTSEMAIRRLKADEELKIEKQRIKERVLEIDKLSAAAEVSLFLIEL